MRKQRPIDPKSTVLLNRPEIAKRLGITARHLDCDKWLFKALCEYGMFNFSIGARPYWKMTEADLELFIEAFKNGCMRYTGAAGTRPEPGDSQCASQPVNQGSDGEPSGPELANLENSEL